MGRVSPPPTLPSKEGVHYGQGLRRCQWVVVWKERWWGGRRLTGCSMDPLSSSCIRNGLGGTPGGGEGCHSRPGGREGDRDDVGRMVGPTNQHPNTPHTPKRAGPPGGPSQVGVSKGRSGCVVASSVPLCLQEEGPGHGTGRRAPAVARPVQHATRMHLNYPCHCVGDQS